MLFREKMKSLDKSANAKLFMASCSYVLLLYVRFFYLLPFEYACLPGVISIICGRLDLLSIFWGHHGPWFRFLSDFLGALNTGWTEILIGAIFWLSFLFASTGSHYYKCAPVASLLVISWMSRFTACAAMAPFSSQHLRSLSLIYEGFGTNFIRHATDDKYSCCTHCHSCFPTF